MQVAVAAVTALGQHHPLAKLGEVDQQGLVVLGEDLGAARQAEHDIRIEHEAVSRLQAEVVLRGDKFVLVDHSTNGTYVQLESGPLLRLVREELALAGRGRIVPGIDGGVPILFRFTSA